MSLGSKLKLPGEKDIPLGKEALKAGGSERFVEMIEKKWGTLAGLGAAWFMEYLGFAKPENEEKGEEKPEEKSGGSKAKEALAKLKDKVTPKEQESEKEQSAEVKKEDLKKAEIDERLAIRSDKMTVSEDIELTRQIESMEANQRVMFALMLAREKFKTGGMHCWDWVDKIYTGVGCERRVIYRNVDYKGQDCRVAPHAVIKGDKIKLPDGRLVELQPGDHISINNRNKADKGGEKRGGGNHSVVFLGWAGEGVAKVVGYTAKSNTSLAYNVDLNKQPVVHISKPVIKEPVDLAVLNYQLKKQPAEIRGDLPERIV